MRRWKPRSTLLMVLTVITAVTVCGAARASASHPNHLTPPEQSVGRLVLAQAFPENSRDAALEGRLSSFQRAVSKVAVSRCLRAAGLPGAPGQFPAGPLNLDFPNLSWIRRTDSTGFLISYKTPEDPASHMSTADRAKYEAALSSCEKSTLRADRLYVVENGRRILALASSWNRALNAIYASSAATRAGRSAEQCSAARGVSFHVSPGDDAAFYFDAVFSREERLLKARDNSRARHVDRSAADLFITCFGGYEHVLDRLRASKHTQLFKANPHEIARYERSASAAVVQLERQYRTVKL
jgi:hypothetical protein